jgi:Phosphotransferase enzyme family
MHDAALEFARRVLGPCELVRDHTWAHRMSSVRCLQDAQGATWFVKRHSDRDRHEAEVLAYREWVPALGSSAPFLRSVDESLTAIIVSAVPGEPAPWPASTGGALSTADRDAEQRVQHEAGRLLRRFHEAKPARPWGDVGAVKLDELGRLMPVAAGLLSARELARVRAEVAALDGVACPGRVPCHRDYTPRNWLVGHDAQFIVDFEWARLDVWISDLARLHLGI